jgi:hypothetical protein
MKLPPGTGRLARPGHLVLAAVLGAGFAFTGCSVETPSASTSTNFVISIPVADDSTRIDEMVGDRDDFLDINDATGGMSLRVAVPLDDPAPGEEPEILGTAQVGENLRVTPTANSFSTAIGQLSIPGQTIPEISVDFATITGQSVPAGTELPAVPGVEFGTAVPLPLANVTSLSIDAGGLSVDVANDMPVALTNVRLELFDEEAGAAVDAIDLGTIDANGGQASGAFALDGRTISGDLSVSVSGSTVASTQVTVGENAELRINSELQTLLVSQATALIPQQEFEDNQTLDFPDDRIQVTEAVMSSGGLTLVVTNNIPIIMEVELTLPDLVDANGNAQVFLIDELRFGQPREVTFDLTDNVFAPANPLQMRIGYRARTFESDTEVTIASDGEIEIEAITEELVFSRVQGRLNQIRLEISAEEKDRAARSVDFPAGLDNIAIDTADLTVFLTSGVGFLADVDIVFTGYDKETGATETLTITETFERGNPLAPVSNTLNVRSDALTDFLNFLPDSISVDPVIIVGDGQEEEIIETNHFVSLDSVVFGTAPRLQVLGDTRIDPDVRDISFRDSETRAKIGSNFRGAKVVTEFESSIPIGIGVRLFVAHDRDLVYTNPTITVPPLTDPPFQVPAAPTDASGLSNGSVTHADTLDLTVDEVVEFILEDDRSDSLFSGVRVTLPATDGVVEVRATDFINVIAGLRLELELNEDLVD